MNTKTPLILISNDDGYQAPGINKLINMLRPLDVKILVCAPDGPRSGYSCAFSSELPLRLWHKWSDDKVDVWACNGTPVDCVKLAIDQLLEGKMPDMVIGGINHGDNSTVNNHYSGTMGIAKEGCMKYIPSIAISSCYYNHDANFDPLIEYVRNIVSNVLANGLPRGVCLNVNFPAMQEFKGVKVCPLHAQTSTLSSLHLCHNLRAYSRRYRPMGFVAWLCCHHAYTHRRYGLRDDRHHQELESVEPIFIA